MRQVLGPGALGRPRGIGWRGRWEGGSGWGTHVNPWLIHVSVWQNPLQCCEVISLQLIKINEKKKKEWSCCSLLLSGSADLRSQTLWELVFPLWDPGLGGLAWGLGPLFLGESLWSCDFPPLLRSPVCGGLYYTGSLSFLPVSFFLLYIFSCGKAFLLV